MYEDDVELPEIGIDDLDERPPIVREMAIPGFSDEQLLRLRARYLGTVSFIDAQLARIYDRLEELGAADDVLTVFTADHGSAIGDRGFQTKGSVSTPAVAGVPLVVHWPEGIEGGRSHDWVTQLIDLYPTFLDLADVAVPDYTEGKSLASVLPGDDDPVHDGAVDAAVQRTTSSAPRPVRARIRNAGALDETPQDVQRDRDEGNCARLQCVVLGYVLRVLDGEREEVSAV